MQGELFSRELLIGPAGCGKTHRVLERYLAEVEAGREEQVLLLVPTASFRDHTRNTVLRSGRVRAFSGGSVATFDDLTRESPRPELTGARRELMVRRILRELDLPYLRDVAELAGFRQTLVEEAEEILNAGLSAGELERRLKPNPRSAAFLKFLRRYEAETAPFRRPVEIAKTPALLLVDGFTDFTVEQKRLLETLAKPAGAALATLPQGYEPARKFLLGLGFRETVLEGNYRVTGSLETAVFTASSRRDEVDLVARQILCLVRDERYSFRDIGIVMHDQDHYLSLIGDLFRSHGIPVRMFFPTEVAETALGRHLLACLDLFGSGSRPPAVLAVLKSPYSPIFKRELVEDFEYRLIENRAQAEHGRWPVFWKPLKNFFQELERFDQELREAGSDAQLLARWVTAVWDAFTKFREVLPESHERALDLRADARAWTSARELVQEIAEAAEAEKDRLDFAAFADLLEQEMRQARFRRRDRRQDAVSVMNPYEARQWELRAVFVMGLVEKEFPRAPRPSLFLDEAGRQGLGLPTAAEQAEEERRLFDVATTRARERLFLSHPLTDPRGTPLLRSFFLDDIACARRLERSPADIVCPEELVVAERDLFDLAHRELGAPWASPERLGPARALYNAAPRRELTARAASSLESRPASLALPAALRLVAEKQSRFSASSFKTFGQCAFKHFAGYVLRLQGPPEEAEGLTRLVEGTIIHETLREWEAGRRAEPIGWVFERCFAAETEGLLLTHAEEKLRQDMRADLERFATAEARHDSLYRCAVDADLLEKKFGRGDGPVLEWTLPDGATIQITGRLDRVETATQDGKKLGVLVDFKYSKEGFTAEILKRVEEGQEFQIPLYLLALEQLFGLQPAGAELYALRGGLSRAGVFNEELATAVFRGGSPPETQVLPPKEFRTLLETGRQWMAKYAAEIRAGKIAVAPREITYCHKGGCEYYDLCRVNKWEIPTS